MDELKMVKLAELRGKMASMPVKLLVTFLLVAGAFWGFSFDKFKENILMNIATFVIMYSLICYFWLCVRVMHNWLLGIILGAIVIMVYAGISSKLGNVVNIVAALAICFGGAVMDILTIIRYFMIKKSVFSGFETGGEEGYTGYGGQDAYEDGADYEERAGYEEQRGQGAFAGRGRQAKEEPVFFGGCKDQASIKRRYRDLCRVYHPDNGNGSAEIFNRITEEYNELMEQYN